MVGPRESRHQLPPVGRERGLYSVGDPATARRLVVTATAAEILSRRQADGNSPDIAFIATGGDPQPDQVRRIAGLAAARPELGVELVVAQGADAAKTIGPLLRGLQAVRAGLHHPNRDGVPGLEAMALMSTLGGTLPAGVLLTLPARLGQGIDNMQGKGQNRQNGLAPGRNRDAGFER